jgi:hypothetical protein
MSDDLSTYTDEGLAIACATEIMRWRVGDFGDNGSVPCLYISPVSMGFRVRRQDTPTTVIEPWEPWREPRAWMEIVERMSALGYDFTLGVYPNGDCVAGFSMEMETEEAAKLPGRAVMLAALKITRGIA